MKHWHLTFGCIGCLPDSDQQFLTKADLLKEAGQWYWDDPQRYAGVVGDLRHNGIWYGHGNDIAVVQAYQCDENCLDEEY